MTELFAWIFRLFLSPLGLVGLAALDSSMLFFLPAAVDTAVVILSARYHELFWLFPILAAAGSVIGASGTFWIGCKIGENSLEYWVSKKRLERVRCKIKSKGAIALALPAIMPPPFPLTPFILACGALSVSTKKFFITLALMRLLRFGAVSVLGLVFGRKILAILESDIFKGVIAFFFLVALAGTAYTAYRVIVTTRTYRSKRSSAPAKDAA